MIRFLQKQHRFRPFFLFFLAFILIISFSFPVINAQEESKSKLEDWQLNGILAALDDPYLEVQRTAFRKVSEYDWQNASSKERKNLANQAAEILKDENVDQYVRRGAAVALGNLGDAAKPHIKDIAEILKDEKVEPHVRGDAAVALGNLGDAAKNYIPDIVDILKDDNFSLFTRGNAAEILGNLGDAAKPYVKDIVEFLKDEKVDSFVRGDAAVALGNLGYAAKEYIPSILEFVKDEKVDLDVRGKAVIALGNLGDAAKPYVKDIVEFLKDEKVNLSARSNAAVALGNLGDAAKPYVKDIVEFLKDEQVNSYVRGDAAKALEQITVELELESLVVVFNNIYYAYYSYNFPQWRFQAYFLGGGTEEVKTLLTWLGNEDRKGIPEKLTTEEGREILQLFDETWKHSEGLKPLRKDLAGKIAEVAKKTKSWQLQDMALLQTHYDNLKAAKSTHADAILSVRNNLKYWKWFFRTRTIILTHILFWLALIFAYPKSPQIQAIFFWNPWVRKILGVGYVDFFLTWIPFLRRKLFEPFQFSLLADAELDEFSAPAYFPNSYVRKKLGESQPLTQAIPAIKGEIVLQGDSGLGKSMFLRHLLHTSRRVVVYLPARKCDKGVIAAIQAKLHGQAKDEAFLKNLIYSGAIDICIDGLNEVTADTRAQIRQFVESYFRGNIIMTTQPLEWEPPATATTYYLQPLAKEQIKEFLLSRQGYLSPDAVIQGDSYRQACVNYLNKILDESQSEEELTAAQNILSNPMDLTVVSQMLSHDKQPELFSLVEQQYNLMAEEYQENWNQPFPIEKFSEAVYKMRLKDESILPTEKFYNELIAMEDEKYKMVVSRQWQDNKGKRKQQWCFRHDKIMDFFLVQTFLGDSEQVQSKLIDHMGDPRFRGVYFLLANLLSPEDALSLREELIQYAADTRDHTVSDTFVTLLRTRPQLSQRN